MSIPKCNLDKRRGKKAPLYKQVCDQLSSEIKAGRFAAGERLPSVSSLVKAWDVNYQTVNLALARMEERGLIRCDPGRGKGPVVLVGSTQKFNLVFIRWSNEGYPMEICEGIRSFAEEKKIRFSIAKVDPGRSSLADMMDGLSAPNTGLIMVPMHSEEFNDVCWRAQERGDRMVFLDEYVKGLPVSSVSIDHAGGAHRLTTHLLQEHGRPVYCFGDPSRFSVQERIAGWESAMLRHGFADLRACLYEGPAVRTMDASPGATALIENREAARRMLTEKAGKEPLSIFACTDYAAQGVYFAAEDLGLQVGTDLFIGGFGDDTFCQNLPGPLTHIQQDWEQLGREGASILVAEMSGVIQQPMHHLLPAKLQIRRSSLRAG